MDGLETTLIEDCRQNEALISEPFTRMRHVITVVTWATFCYKWFEELEHVFLLVRVSLSNAVPLALLIRLVASFCIWFILQIK